MLLHYLLPLVSGGEPAADRCRQDRPHAAGDPVGAPVRRGRRASVASAPGGPAAETGQPGQQGPQPDGGGTHPGRAVPLAGGDSAARLRRDAGPADRELGCRVAAGRAGTRLRKTMTLTTSLRNVGVGLVIATGTFAGTPAVTATLVYGLFEVFGSLLLALAWARLGTATRSSRSRLEPPRLGRHRVDWVRLGSAHPCSGEPP